MENAGGLGFWARLWMWIWLPWKVLFSPEAAWRVRRALEGAGEPAEAEASQEAEAQAREKEEARRREAALREAGALQLLAILQRDGRLVDFLQEELGSASDQEVGAAARIVHEGCRKSLSQYLTLAPIRAEEEGSAITVEADFDPAELRLSGNVVGQPPLRGRLAHPGWRATEVKIPILTSEQDPRVVAPAEIEV